MDISVKQSYAFWYALSSELLLWVSQFSDNIILHVTSLFRKSKCEKNQLSSLLGYSIRRNDLNVAYFLYS